MSYCDILCAIIVISHTTTVYHSIDLWLRFLHRTGWCKIVLGDILVLLVHHNVSAIMLSLKGLEQS